MSEKPLAFSIKSVYYVNVYINVYKYGGGVHPSERKWMKSTR